MGIEAHRQVLDIVRVRPLLRHGLTAAVALAARCQVQLLLGSDRLGGRLGSRLPLHVRLRILTSFAISSTTFRPILEIKVSLIL